MKPRDIEYIYKITFGSMGANLERVGELIRCADCKWMQCNMRNDGYLPKGVSEYECRHWCGACDPTDFCSYAERKEE